MHRKTKIFHLLINAPVLSFESLSVAQVRRCPNLRRNPNTERDTDTFLPKTPGCESRNDAKRRDNPTQFRARFSNSSVLLTGH